MQKVPFSASTPDVVGHRSFYMERIGEYAALAFRDVLPLAARDGGAAIITYPFVLAVCEARDGSVVLFVTVEKGEMFGTSALCGFDGDGTHHYFGSWNMDQPDEAFVERAVEIARAQLRRQ
jgi:hypothetical protein